MFDPSLVGGAGHSSPEQRSRDTGSIFQEANDLFERGYREITLLGQNVNSYRWTEEEEEVNPDEPEEEPEEDDDVESERCRFGEGDPTRVASPSPSPAASQREHAHAHRHTHKQNSAQRGKGSRLVVIGRSRFRPQLVQGLPFCNPLPACSPKLLVEPFVWVVLSSVEPNHHLFQRVLSGLWLI